MSIDVLSVDPVYLSHALAKIGIRGFHREVIMTGHQAIGMNDPIKSLADFSEIL